MYRKHTVRKREDVTKEAIVEAGVEEVHADRGQDPAVSTTCPDGVGRIHGCGL